MDMMEEFAFYGSLILRCIIVYFVIILALRVMGKREVGELSVFDVVIYLVMSELLAISITDVKVSIFRSLVPITVLALLQIGFINRTARGRIVTEKAYRHFGYRSKEEDLFTLSDQDE